MVIKSTKYSGKIHKQSKKAEYNIRCIPISFLLIGTLSKKKTNL